MKEQDYHPQQFSYAPITDMQIHRVICWLGPHKALVLMESQT